ncbi:MAG TPA: lysophospholipid acyltransferase family protein [Planctomycetota bacterium]|nr:lysophospholipid acyltransferase family protein [Planctomycetota bacterium]
MLKHLGFRLITTLADLLPRTVQYWIAHRVADAHYMLDRPARKAVLANLRVILGADASEAALKAEARWVFRSFGMYLCEFFGHRRFGRKFVDEHVVVQGRENLDAALKAGRGAIFCSGHYSNWELGGTIVAHLGYPLWAVVQQHADTRTNAMFVSQREAMGINVVHSEHGAVAALKALRRNETVALIADRPTGGPVIGVTVFGKRTYLPQGPWRIALASGTALLPTFVHRRFNNQYTFDIGAALPLPTDGTREERMAALAQSWANCLEARVKSDPSQWAVFYRVWDDPETGAKGIGQSLATRSKVIATAGEQHLGEVIEESERARLKEGEQP